ncbi:MAG: hypothetical protein Tsb0021_07040 [Chlamydiales bacterium]
MPLMSAFTAYELERQSLSNVEIEAILDSGHQWKFGHILNAGGGLLFPHTYLKQCGHQIAAVVQACLDSDADQIVVLGVLHPNCHALKKLMEAHSTEEQKKGARGIWGPDIGGKNFWQDEFSLHGFLFLWEHEVKRRGIKAPKLYQRYPLILGNDVSDVKGIKELEQLAKDAVVVMTGDLCHHGAAYNHMNELALNINDYTKVYAKEVINHGFSLLEDKKIDLYKEHCKKVRNDCFETSLVFNHLKGLFSHEISDIQLINTDQLYPNETPPNWVAASLVKINAL